VKTVIKARINVAGFHSWPDAPQRRAYLRLPHRHDFVIIGEKQVQHPDRATEFHDLCDQMESAIAFELYPDCRGSGRDFGTASCEMIAAAMMRLLGLDACEVLEDGINGARVTNESALLAA
jgi:hypothetical protein